MCLITNAERSERSVRKPQIWTKSQLPHRQQFAVQLLLQWLFLLQPAGNFHRQLCMFYTPFFSIQPFLLLTHANSNWIFFFEIYIKSTVSRRRSKKMQSMNQQKSSLPITGLPVNCCGPTPSPNGPLGSLATLSAFNSHKVKKSIFRNRNKLTITKL